MTALLAFLCLLLATPDMTKEEVKRLVAAGISDDVIVEYVRANAPLQQLSAQDLIDLRQANVSEKVLSAMMEANRAPAVAPSQTQESAPTVIYSYSSPWYYPSRYSYPGPYVYPYYSRYPSYAYPYYSYPYYNRPYYGYPYRYSYPYRYGPPPSVHNYRNQPTPQHRGYQGPSPTRPPAPSRPPSAAPSNPYRGHR